MTNAELTYKLKQLLSKCDAEEPRQYIALQSAISVLKPDKCEYIMGNMSAETALDIVEKLLAYNHPDYTHEQFEALLQAKNALAEKIVRG